MENKKIKAVIVEPNKKARIAEIESGLKSLQSWVGGFIQAVYPFDDPVVVICNEEGKLEGLPNNRALLDEKGDIYDILAGTFLVLGLGEEDFDSLPDDLAEKYQTYYEYPQIFLTDSVSRHTMQFTVKCELPDDTCSIFTVIEHGSVSNFWTTPGEELLEICQKIRDYMDGKSGERIVWNFHNRKELTRNDVAELTLVRMANVGVVRGSFTVDFDAKMFYALNIMDGWGALDLQTVVEAANHVDSANCSTEDEKWRELVDFIEPRLKRE